jgi:heat shock protein HtpX
MFKTALLFGLLIGIFVAIGYALGGMPGMTVAFVLALGINFFSYWFSDKIVLKLYGAKPSDNKELNSIVEKVAKEAQIPVPKAYLMKTNVPNAFATGRDPKHSAIAVTQGLLELEPNEIEGVIGHEMAHIKNRDILVSTLAATIAGAISFIAQMAYWGMFSGDRRSNGVSIVGIILIMVFAPLAALLVRLAISRSREYKADSTGASITGNPSGLASALRKISTYTASNPVRGNSATSHMWIVNPFQSGWFTSLFSTHPPINERISRLQHMKV